MFSPSVFHDVDNPGKAAAKSLRRNLHALEPDLAGHPSLIFVFVNDKETLLDDLIFEGIVSSAE